jgi:hypothetical protein
MKRTALAGKPDMDELAIGPDGETFGQLKQRVRDTRAAYTACSTDNPELPRYGDELAAAVARLRAAYTRVGLRYKAP